MKEISKALFLDMDWTLIYPPSGGTFPKNKDDWAFLYKNIIGKIHSYHYKGYKIIIVSNQGGVEANFITMEEVQEKFNDVRKALEKEGTEEHYIHWYICPSMEGYKRKPLPGMAYQAALHFDLDLSESIMVGDMESDSVFAQNAGLKKFYLADDFFGEENKVVRS